MNTISSFLFDLETHSIQKLIIDLTFNTKWPLSTKCRNMVYIGEVIGAFSITIGNRSGPLKRAASASMLYQPVDVHSLFSYPLRGRVRSLLHKI